MFSKRLLPYLAISIAFLATFMMLGQLTPQRVGDGTEYYALFYAWSDTLRPWMTVTSFDSYERFVSNGDVVGLMPRVWLENAFPTLRAGDTADFNHFWFYSLLAFLAAKLLGIIGIANGPHHSYLALHFLLLLSVGLTSFHFFRWRGFAAFLIMTLTTPMVWFFDKVHTEIFTYSTVLLSVLLLLRNRYLASACVMAIASTQNPSFALIAFIPFAYRILVLRRSDFSLTELIFAVSTALLVLAHPVYYFLRYGVPTPQFIAGGASPGENLSTFYIWLLDPDLGLLPNWPAGILFLLAAVGLSIWSTKKSEFFKPDLFLIFIIIFFAVNFFAHSSTVNLNSGATRGVARYSLWYLPVFFPLINHVLSAFPRKKLFLIPGGITLSVLLVFSLAENTPNKGEEYATPSKVSSLIQTQLSHLYDPPPEVFAERYSGVGEMIHSFNPKGIIGPDCKKILVYPGEDRVKIFSPPECFFDNSKIANHLADFVVNASRVPVYSYLDKKLISETSLVVARGDFYVGNGKNGNRFLLSGWSTPESWGVWSDSRIAKISFPCNQEQFYYNDGQIKVNLQLQPFGQQGIQIANNGTVVFQGDLTEPTSVGFVGTVNRCRDNRIDFTISISNPLSPNELGHARDVRKLGVGLTKITIDSVNE